MLMGLVLTLGACDSLFEYDSVVTIENIEKPEHVEHFTLSAEDDEETYIVDDFEPEMVDGGTLEYTFESLVGDAEIILNIDNDKIFKIEGGYYPS